MRKFWGIDQFPKLLIAILRKVPRLSQLRSSYYASATFAAAASKFGNEFLQKISSTTLLYIKWFASECYPNEQVETETTAIVCDTILNEVEQVRDLLRSGELPLLEWSRQRHSRLADDLEAQMCEEDNNPTFVPQKQSGSSSDEDEPPVQKAKRRRVTTGKDTENNGNNNLEVSPSLPANPKTARPAQRPEDAENDGQSTSEVSPSLPASPKQKPASARTARRRAKTKDAENDGQTTLEVSPSLPASLTLTARPGQQPRMLKMMDQQHRRCHHPSQRPQNQRTGEVTTPSALVRCAIRRRATLRGTFKVTPVRP